MRVGFQVNRTGAPIQGAQIQGTLTTGFPFLPAAGVTDANGEWFGVAPLAVSPANYFMSVSISDGAGQVSFSGVYDEIANLFIVDLDTGEWVREKLPARIPGDAYWSPDPMPLSEADLVDVSQDPVRGISSCATCLYYAPLGAPQGQCLVNGPTTPPIPIADAPNTSSRLFYPFFLHPASPPRLARDLSRLRPGPEEGAPYGR